MKFLLYACCLSIVWGIVFAGCGSKHYENMPHDAIHIQAKSDAESDVSHDANALADFGAGVSVPFTAVSCGYMTAYLAVLIVDISQHTSSNPSVSYGYCPGISALVGSAAVSSLLIAHFSRPLNPPPERLIGKSPEYVKFYVDAYRSKMRSYRIRHVAAGSIVSCASITATFTIILTHLLSSGGLD